MMSAGEKELLYRLARNHYRGEGLIVDAGLFLGASTRAFAQGVRDGGHAPSWGKPINSYDIAIWVRGMNKYLTRPQVQKTLKGMEPPVVGKSFAPTLKALLADDLDLIDLRLGDIVELASADRPIEIAFYDCIKTYDRDLAAFRAFGPHYTPDRTIVVQQDYFYWTAPEHRVRQEFLADYFRFEGQVRSTAVFRCIKALPEAWFEADPVAALSPEEQVRLIDRAADRATADFALETRLSAAVALAAAGRMDAAERRVAEVLADNDREPDGKRADRIRTLGQDLRAKWLKS
ncbi:MAG: hypothetical protein EON87_12600 [Brevundimonas sp.]|nr:MAG: hypothetical protein EON87_12600 [Brevundimonas sp.]